MKGQVVNRKGYEPGKIIGHLLQAKKFRQGMRRVRIAVKTGIMNK